jgi:hypothetical protein
MAVKNAIRIIKNAPYQHDFIFINNNQGIIETPSGLGNIEGWAMVESAPAGSVTPTFDDPVVHAPLTAVQMRGDAVFLYVYSNSTAKTTESVYGTYIRPEPCLDSGEVSSATASGITLAGDGHTPSANADAYNGAIIEIVRGVGAGQVRTIVDYTSPTATIDHDWATNPDSTSVYIIKGHGTPLLQDSANMRTQADVLQINSDTTAAQNLELLYEGAFITSTAVGAQTTTTITGTDADLSNDNDTYNDMLLVFTSGVNQGIPRKIEDYVGADSEFTVTAFPNAPSATDTFILIALIA